MRIKRLTPVLALSVVVAGLSASPGYADEFTPDQLASWRQQFLSVVNEGRELWVSDNLGKNRVACAQCHPNAVNTHPETYPKFQKQLGKVAPMWEMINWCIRNPLEGEELSADDPRMTALQAYITYERRGVVLEPGKH